MAWHEQFRTDISSIDEEHQDLVRAVDRLPDTVAAGGEADFLARLDRLFDEVQDHFAREERIMRNIVLPDLHHHIALHHRLLSEVREAREQLARNFDAHTPRAIKDYLRYWLVHHITAEDIKIRHHLHHDLEQSRRAAS